MEREQNGEVGQVFLRNGNSQIVQHNMGVPRALVAVAALCLLAGSAGAREREPNASYAERRTKLRAQVNGPVALFGYTGQEDASPAYVFNQEHYFYYLTGHNEPGAAVLIVPDPPAGQTYDGPREVLYLPARNPQRERWDGVRLSPDDQNIGGHTGFATVKSTVTLRADLEALAKIYPTFHTLLPGRSARGYPHRERRLDWLKEVVPSAEFQDVTRVISAMRQVKSPSEVALIQNSAELSMDAHLEAMRMMRPGIWEYEVAAKMEYVHKAGGCEGEAYAPIVGSGFNSTVLHYSMPVNQIKDGDVIVLDVGAQCSGYAADITRTLPASGKFSPRQREIYEIVLGAQSAVLAALKPGMTMGLGPNGLGQIATDYINSHGKDKNGEPLGKYFIHGLGHHVGLYVHDPGPPRPLEPGMIVTIEPGIYIPEENLGVRIEDMVLITETGYKLMTARLPRTVEDVERTMADGKKARGDKQ
jgi:Xaa-Pro aminopeptidase